MKDEIKEIIRLNCDEEIDVKYFAKDDSLVDTTMDYSQLLDYITNLQEENEKVHKDFDELSERYFFTKSRNEKATEYINKYLPNYDFDKSNLNELLNILQGVDKE